MTHSTFNNAHITTDDDYTNTMQSLSEFIGLHYYATRAVFDIDGNELVYFNDNFFGRISLYLNGEEIYKGWRFCSFIFSDIAGQRNGHEYRVISSIRNWFSCAQKITVIIDDSKAQSKVDPVLGGVKGKALLHAVGGSMLFGLFVGFSLSYLGL